MSALGQKQTCAAHKPMSAKCQKRTLVRLLDHLGSGSEKRLWRGKAEGLGGLKIDHQLIFGWRLNRHVGWLLAQDQCHPGQVVAR